MDYKIQGSQYQQLKSDIGNFNLSQKKPREPEKDKMDQQAFLKLLTVQMSKQDPLSPMKNTEFMAQMAQFSALEQMTMMNKGFDELRGDFGLMRSQSLLGQRVQYFNESLGEFSEGQVESIAVAEDGGHQLNVSGSLVDPHQVKTVYSPVEMKSAGNAYNQNQSTKNGGQL